MALSFMKIDELPLGCRMLRLGCYGRDVIEVQKLLKEAGFYFGEPDGWYGVLTGEAVTLLQRTFRLRVDGIVGPEVLRLLLQKASKNGRIIYRVNNNESLDWISKQFGVKKSAWRRIPGQGDPHKKIYPGLKMLLHEKILLSWESSGLQPLTFPVTGMVNADYEMDMESDSLSISRFQNDVQVPESIVYHVISSTREVWNQVLTAPKLWDSLVKQLTALKNLKFGFDLREAPIEKFPRWKDLLHFIHRKLDISSLEFQVLPLLPVQKKFENRLYWVNLPMIGSYTKYILLDPVYTTESPDLFQESAAAIYKAIAGVIKTGLTEKIILVCQTSGWSWNLDQNFVERIPYKVAQLLRGQYANIQHLVRPKLSRIDYRKHQERCCLIYRDEDGWREFLNHTIQLNFAGVVMVDFQSLGKTGPEIIAGSFKVQKEDG